MIDTKALRQKILDMAIRGKLVPQDPNDESASVLLERIREEKQRLIKEGKIKKNKNDSVIFKGDDNRYYEKVGSQLKDITDELPFEIPDGWSWTRFTQIVSFDLGKTPDRHNKKYWDDGKYPWFAISDLQERATVNSTKEKISAAALRDKFAGELIPQGTLLMSFKLTVGKTSILGIDAVHNEAIISIFPIISEHEITRNFLLNALPVIVLCVKKREAVKGVTLNSSKLAAMFIPLPPLAEQQRIVSRVDELLAQIDIIEQNQADIDTLYEEFKKRTLTLAIQGKLVPQDPNDEPASVLLERIRAEKKAKLGKKYVDSYIYKGDDNCYYEKVGETVTNISNEIPFDLPENWSYSRLETMITLLSGRDLEPNQYNSQRAGIPYITGASNIEHGSLIINRWTTNSATISRKGDLLITCKGTVGTMALNNVGDIHIARQIMAINADGVCLNYIRLFLESHVRVLQNKAKSFIPGISRQDLLKAIMPIPPFNEQLRIVEQYKTIYKQLKDED
ncbi:MAG: hypothetical protein DBX65_01565 [Oscillospiraceae bacterium]|nr:MAG: hypothetical protein DBX65_01565 [Oscillospiraceae bacterium]